MQDMGAACPDCGFSQPCESMGNAHRAASAHNASCREQKERKKEWVDRPKELQRPWLYREPSSRD